MCSVGRELALLEWNGQRTRGVRHSLIFPLAVSGRQGGGRKPPTPPRCRQAGPPQPLIHAGVRGLTKERHLSQHLQDAKETDSHVQI